MNLLEKANTITTPTAYSDGFLHSVKPEVVWNTTYESDFAVSESFQEAGGVGSINQTIDGVSGAYKFTLSGGATNHYFYGLPISNGKRYRIKFKYYIPSGQSINYIRSGIGPAEITFNTIGQWAEAEYIQTATQVYAIFRLQTVNADGDSIYLKDVSVEKDISADFTFTRNSSATRVNELGYIEDVQIIGGEDRKSVV